MLPLIRYVTPVRSWLSIFPGVAAVLISSLANLRLRKSKFLLQILFFLVWSLEKIETKIKLFIIENTEKWKDFDLAAAKFGGRENARRADSILKIQLVYCVQQRSFMRAFAGPLNPILA